MTAIGKVLALLNLVGGLAILTWAVGVYVERPGWFEPAPEGVDKGNSPLGFAQMKAEGDALARGAGVASEAWGTHMKALEEREKVRADRRAANADRLRWAHKGHPKHPVDKDNPKSAGVGFYEPVRVDDGLPKLRADLKAAEDKGQTDVALKLRDDLRRLTLVSGLYDLRPDPITGLPRGKPAVGTDGLPLPGLDGLLDTVSDDVVAIKNLNEEARLQRETFDQLSTQVRATQGRAISMGVIRDSVQAELFFLTTFEVNVFETRETVLRRERQLRGRLKVLGFNDP